VLRYSHVLEEATGIYRLEVDLERVGIQVPMSELAEIPCPSDFDDWQLYEKLETEKKKKKEASPDRGWHRWREGEGSPERELLTQQDGLKSDINPERTIGTSKSAMKPISTSRLRGYSVLRRKEKQKKADIDITKNK
jgi:hypothetical protein